VPQFIASPFQHPVEVLKAQTKDHKIIAFDEGRCGAVRPTHSEAVSYLNMNLLRELQFLGQSS
jgi:hypothetical protein